jgi:hypothetical protein
MRKQKPMRRKFYNNLPELIPMSEENMIWSPETAVSVGSGNCIAKSLAVVSLSEAIGNPSGLCFDGGHFWNALRFEDDVYFTDAFFGFYSVNSGPIQRVGESNPKNLTYPINLCADAYAYIPKHPNSERVYRFTGNLIASECTVIGLDVQTALQAVNTGELDAAHDELYIPYGQIVSFLTGYLRRNKRSK